MRRYEELLRLLAAVPGAGTLVLVGAQGEILAHSAPGAEALAAFVALCRQQAAVLQAEFGSSGFAHAVVHRRTHEKLFVVPLGGCTLGLYQRPGAVAAEVLGRVLALKDAHPELLA